MEIILKFKTVRDFDAWVKEVRECIVEAGYCPGILDHYYYNDNGKKIKRGKNLPILVEVKECLKRK